MRKLVLIVSATAALLVGGALADRADALTLGNPAGLRAAAEDLTMTEPVQYRRGWGWGRSHYRWARPWWGPRYRRAYIAPFPFYFGPRYYRPHYWGYGYRVGPRYAYYGPRWRRGWW
jgi:hypothetical protein